MPWGLVAALERAGQRLDCKRGWHRFKPAYRFEPIVVLRTQLPPIWNPLPYSVCAVCGARRPT